MNAFNISIYMFSLNPHKSLLKDVRYFCPIYFLLWMKALTFEESYMFQVIIAIVMITT